MIQDVTNSLIQRGLDEGWLQPIPDDCDHEWQYRPDWGGDDTIPNGTFDASSWYCPECDTEVTEQPDDWEPPFVEPYED